MTMKSIFSFESPIIAHRGASHLAPENTLAAFRKAAELGVKWVEFDVMLAACGEVVVIHDETLDRTTNGKGNVCDFPYSYLKTLDAGSGEKIPTLKEVIELLREWGLTANIEIKPSVGKEEETVKKVLHVVDQYWHASMKPPLISSFSLMVLNYLRQYSKTHFLAYLMHDWNPDWKKISDELNCVSVDIHYKILNQARVNEVKATNRFVFSYTVDDPLIAQQLFDLGVDAIFTNCPEKMMGFL